MGRPPREPAFARGQFVRMTNTTVSLRRSCHVNALRVRPLREEWRPRRLSGTAIERGERGLIKTSMWISHILLRNATMADLDARDRVINAEKSTL